MVRATAFTPETIARLRTEFVPYAGDRHEVCGRASTLRDWFWPMAESVNPRVPRGETAQGFYIAGADGTGYGWLLTGDPRESLAFLRTGLQRFREKPPRPVAIDPGSHARTGLPGPDTAVVRVHCRVPGLPPQTDVVLRSVGRDHLWIYPGELRQVVAACRNSAASISLPATLVARIARFHLIDTSGGHWGGWWSDTEVKKAVVTATVTGRDRSRRTVSFAGEFLMRSADGKDGFDGTLAGELEVDVSAEKLVRFRAYGRGHGWGEHGWPRVFGESPPDPRPRFPLVFAMREAADEAARSVPPVALFHGAPYESPAIAPAP